MFEFRSGGLGNISFIKLLLIDFFDSGSAHPVSVRIGVFLTKQVPRFLMISAMPFLQEHFLMFVVHLLGL